MKNEGCQTKLQINKDPFKEALWRLDNPSLAEKRDKEMHDAMYPRTPIIQEVPL